MRTTKKVPSTRLRFPVHRKKKPNWIDLRHHLAIAPFGGTGHKGADMSRDAGNTGANRDPLVLALGAMLGASALVAATSLIAKVLGLNTAGTALHPLQISAGRFCFALLILAIVSLHWRPALSGAPWRLHAARSLCGWLGVTCLFAAAARMPLADATAISLLSPLVTVVLAALLLRESVGPRRWFAILVAAAGALVLTRPGTEAFRPAAFIALGAALMMGLEAILIKRLSDSEPPLRILLINNTFGALIASTAALFVWRWPEPGQWLLLAGLGATMVVAQSMFIQAMRRGDASYVIPAYYATLIFAALYDYWLFSVVPESLAMAGAALIVVGVLALTFAARPGRQV